MVQVGKANVSIKNVSLRAGVLRFIQRNTRVVKSAEFLVSINMICLISQSQSRLRSLTCPTSGLNPHAAVGPGIVPRRHASTSFRAGSRGRKARATSSSGMNSSEVSSGDFNQHATPLVQGTPDRPGLHP